MDFRLQAFAPGAMFAGYRVESLIGRGGMGVVCRATDLSLGRPVALKMIAPELAQDQRFRDRFLTSASIATETSRRPRSRSSASPVARRRTCTFRATSKERSSIVW
jgi:serine/threonine protein kinase